MKKYKKALAALSAVTTMCAVGLSSVSAFEYHPAPPDYVWNGNKIVSDENTIMTFEDGTKIVVDDNNRKDFALFVIADDNAEITNEILGISDEYIIEQSETAKNVYVISFETQEEMNKLFEQASEWYDKGIIKNAYKQMHIHYNGLYDYNPETGEICVDAQARINQITGEVNMVNQITYLVYNEEDIIGDANGDNQVAANDAAYVAKNLAEKSVNASDVMLDYRADFNKDGKCTAYDCSSIAKYLAEKSIAQAETISE